MIHPNQRAKITAAMKKLLLAHYNVDQVLDAIAEICNITKTRAAELVPKDTSRESREVLALFISAEITTELNKGRTSEDAVRAGLARFDVTTPHETFMNMVRSFEGERNRLAKLRPGEMDNGVGGTMSIVDSQGNPIQVGKKDPPALH